MTSTIPQNQALLKHLEALLEAHRSLFRQGRIYERIRVLLLGEILALGRHTVSQVLVSLGLVGADWSAWYRVFSQQRFREEAAGEVLLREGLKHIREGDMLVLGGDGTQTPRTGRKIEGTSWLRNFRTPVFRVGIHRAQRWFHGAFFLPPEEGYSRAVPLRLLPAFPEKAVRHITAPCKEWEAALRFLSWVLAFLKQTQREPLPILFVADGSYETVAFWKGLPPGVNALLRSAKNRALFHLPPAAAHGRRKYGEQAPCPQAFWQKRSGWKRHTVLIRGRERRLRYRVEGPFLRKTAATIPLMLLVIGGETYTKHGRRKRRDPIPYLVNAVPDEKGNWGLPLPVETLLFWAWQRWELEVCHRELKSNFGLGEKQCWNPHAALASIQWSVWVYALLLLAGYRTWGLTQAPPVPTAWWHGAKRWSFNTLWRNYRAALWGAHTFQPTSPGISPNWLEKAPLGHSWRNALYGSLRL